MTFEQLPTSIRMSGFAPFIAAGAVLASSYGSAFLLADHLRANGLDAAIAGQSIGLGTISTVACTLLAGRLAGRIGVVPAMMTGAMVMGGAMACFAYLSIDARLVYVGGVLLGAGWSTFYALAPLLVVHCVQPQMRLKYFAMSGGAQAAGLGLASPLGHAANSAFGTLSSVYLAFAALCLISTLSLAAAGHLLRRQPRMPLTALTVTRELAVSVLRNRTLAPITMIALAACVMGGFSTYQTAYAESRHLSPDVFFVVFTVTVVLARFTVAPSIGRVPMSSLAFGQCSTMLVALLLYVLNPGSYLLYVIATILFATGYCLVFSTLNAFAMKLAAEDGLSVAATSQVFTLGYFIGLFGFPFIAGVVLSYAGPSRLVVAMMVLIAINLVVLQILERTTAPSLSERVTRRPEPGTLSCAARANSGLAHSPSDAGGPSS